MEIMGAIKEEYHDEIVAGQMAAEKTYTREQLIGAYQKWMQHTVERPEEFQETFTGTLEEAEKGIDYMISLIDE